LPYGGSSRDRHVINSLTILSVKDVINGFRGKDEWIMSSIVTPHHGLYITSYVSTTFHTTFFRVISTYDGTGLTISGQHIGRDREHVSKSR